MKDETFLLKELVPKPFPSVKWLSRRLNAGSIPGSRVPGVEGGWILTREDVQLALAQLKNNTNTANQPTTASSRARRAS
jgi:hypothetical protein